MPAQAPLSGQQPMTNFAASARLVKFRLLRACRPSGFTWSLVQVHNYKGRRSPKAIGRMFSWDLLPSYLKDYIALKKGLWSHIGILGAYGMWPQWYGSFRPSFQLVCLEWSEEHSNQRLHVFLLHAWTSKLLYAMARSLIVGL